MDICTVSGAACSFEFADCTVLTIVLCNCAPPDDVPMRPETCRSLRVLKHYCDFNEECPFCWFTL